MGVRGLTIGVVALALSVSVVVAWSSPAGAAEGYVRMQVRTSFPPRKLPQLKATPASLDVTVNATTADGLTPAPLTRLAFDLDSDIALAVKGLPRCRVPGRGPQRSLEEFKEICGPAVIGGGRLRAAITFPGNDPIPALSPLLIINAEDPDGGASLYALAQLVQPISTSIVMPVAIEKGHGPFGQRLILEVPKIANGAGSIDLLELSFPRRVAVGGADGIVHLRCADAGIAVRARATFLDGSLALADNRRPCRYRQPPSAH